MTRLTKTLLATTVAACVGSILVGGPAQAVPGTGPFATISGTCGAWSTVYGLGDSAPAPVRFVVTAGAIGEGVITGTLAPGSTTAYSSSFVRTGITRIVAVYADGQIIASHAFQCGLPSKHAHR